eukprot:TRINITY_DN92012_c0_g1_i1.p1 TRINITY_DN92012_c0_g1~~TRINITY_DN92012_c0_g1_i1.p1  ORF type:complete len:161 (-),score=30.95 TRINITY_DN92012_c0_g1_i1:64-516(-)
MFLAVLKYFVLEPLGIALLLSMVCSLLLCYCPDIARKVKEEKGLKSVRDEQPEEDEDLGSQRGMQRQISFVVVEERVTTSVAVVGDGSHQLMSILPHTSAADLLSSEAPGGGGMVEDKWASKSMSEERVSLKMEAFQSSDLPGQVSEQAA